jgi:hypothetical protein
MKSRDMDGQLVEVEVPSREFSAIQSGGPPPASATGATAPAGRTVPATIVAVDQMANMIKVRTQQNQLLVLQIPTETMASMQVGEKLTLVVPR